MTDASEAWKESLLEIGRLAARLQHLRAVGIEPVALFLDWRTAAGGQQLVSFYGLPVTYLDLGDRNYVVGIG